MRRKRRRYFRHGIAPDEPMPVTLCLGNAGSLRGQVVNLSLGGICARLPVETPLLGIGQEVCAQLGLGREVLQPPLPSRVAHCRADPAGVFVGLMFLPLPNAQAERERRQAVAKFFVEILRERVEGTKAAPFGPHGVDQ